MSGRDERKIYKIPRCPNCGINNDIAIRYSDNSIAGWIISERLMQELGGIAVLTDRSFNSALEPVVVKCCNCIKLDENLTAAVLMFFKDKILKNEYMTWSEFRSRTF